MKARPISVHDKKQVPPSHAQPVSLSKSVARGHQQGLSNHHRGSSSGGNTSGPPLTVASQDPGMHPIRPQFSTYRQQFDPKQIQQTTVDKLKSLDGVMVIASTSPEIAHLQNELLQLQLILRCSFEAEKTYQRSVMTALEDRFGNIVKARGSVARREHWLDMKANYEALHSWSDRNEPGPFAERLRISSRCVQELNDMMRAKGKLSSTINEFLAWYESTKIVLDERSRGKDMAEDHRTAGSTIAVQPLGESWHESVIILSQQLQQCCRTLDNIDGADGSLGVILSRHRTLANDILLELSDIMLIEKVVLEHKQEFINNCISALLEAGDDIARPPHTGVPRKGVWECE